MRIPKKILESRAMAKVAVAGLATGLITLAGLALSSTISMERAATQVTALNEISDHWGQVLQQTNLEGEALRDNLKAGTAQGRKPLASAIGRAGPNLDWLAHNGEPDDVKAAIYLEQVYRSYSDGLREVVALSDGGDTANAALQAEVAESEAASLRKQIAAIVVTKRDETTAYMREQDQANHRLRFAAAVAFLIDLGLLGLCSLVLLDNQRRVRIQAAKSQHDSLHDGLTGLGNRTLLAGRMSQAILEAQRYNEQVGLLLIDLDKFKEVNDVLGHHVGDALLQVVATRLRAAVRDVDLVARLGGDEFAVLLQRVGSLEDVTTVAQRVHEELCATVDLDGVNLEVGASVGVALYPIHAADAEQLVQRADVAMYVAKRGRLGVTVYDPDRDDNAPAQFAIANELRGALERGEMVLYYEPMADSETGRIRGMEALLRWQHPQRGLLSSSEFIAVADENGLTNALTRYVLANALEQCRQWMSAGMPMPVSVNVGAACLRDRDFSARVVELLDQHGVPADMLTLEIAESDMISNHGHATAVLHELSRSGVQLSIDDLGIGYASLLHSQRLSVQEIKLGRSVVTQMRSNAGDSAIVQALMRLGYNFGLRVVAEGVEDAATWTELKALGCHVIQGHHLGEPIPAADVQKWLDSADPAQHVLVGHPDRTAIA